MPFDAHGFVCAAALLTELSTDESLVTGAIFMSPEPPQPIIDPPKMRTEAIFRNKDPFTSIFSSQIAEFQAQTGSDII